MIGSGPAGVAAAEAYRTHRPGAAIHIVSADSREPYARPPLSKDFLRGETEDVVMHDADWFRERSLELVLGEPVQQVDVAQRTVTVGNVAFPYSAVIFACGASPSPLPVPGGEQALLLRSLDDAQRLREAATSARSAVVIGAGFIGCEAAASLAKRGISVTVVASDEVPQQKRLGDEAGRRLRALVEATGARFIGGVKAESLGDGVVHLDNGDAVEADLVLAATGVTPNVSLAEAAGLTVRDGRIVVGSDMSTGVDGVYAAGDVAMAVNTDIGRAIAVEHWQDATDQGEVAGTSAAGEKATWSGVPGFWSTIGDADVKYHAWGDGYQRSRLVERDGGFTVWYESDGVAVGVLTCNADDDYDTGEELITAGKPPPVAMD